MRTNLTLSLAILLGAAVASPLAAQEARISGSSASAERSSTPLPPSSSLTDGRGSTDYRVAMAEPARAKRCDSLLCPMYMVLGSGF